MPTSKVDKYPDRDKRMLGIRCGKATGKISSESNQLYLTMILSKTSLTDKNVINHNVEPKHMIYLLDDFFEI